MIRALQCALVSAAVLFAALYFLAVGPYWKLTPDSVTYVLGGQSLAAGKGYLEAGSPPSLYPPGTSAIFAVAWIAGRESYRALNAEVVIFALGSLALSFFWLRSSLGTLASGVAVLMCLGSATFFDWSTFLLSDLFYVFFSILGLWLYQRGSTKGTALAVFAGCAVRLIGVSLAAAILIDCLRRRQKRWGLVAAISLSILFVGLWEWRNIHHGASHVGLMLENRPWVRSEGRISPGGLLKRFIGNFAYYPDFQETVTNGWMKSIGWAVVLVPLLALGFRRMFLKGNSVAGIYFVLYSIAVLFYHPWVEMRWFLPLLPLLFAYLIAGTQELAERTQTKWVYAPFAMFLGLYLITGFRSAAARIAVERASPFASEPAKYPANYDLQRLALWWTENAAAGEKYACEHPTLLGVITGREGAHYPFTDRPDALESELRRQQARYVLMDLNSREDREMLLPAIERSGRFRLVREEGRARLYEFF